jgi:UDP-N-acetylglucosamine:LPS N-acetylglucosamine transferase
MFVAGGTGGHINPAVAVATEIRRLDPSAEILFVGTEGRMETQIVPKAGFSIKTVKMNGFCRKKTIAGLIENIKTVILTLKASSTAKKIIKAIEKNKWFKGLPFGFHFIRFCQAVLPIKLFDFIFGEVVGIFHGMDNFTGRK